MPVSRVVTFKEGDVSIQAVEGFEAGLRIGVGEAQLEVDTPLGDGDLRFGIGDLRLGKKVRGLSLGSGFV
jgi:hypothetical protein